MNNGDCVGLIRSHRKKYLAACLAANLGLVSFSAFATVFVTNCDDAGIGSLRNAVAGAPSGDTVDASGLKNVCSKITLKTGAIYTLKNDLTIKGPGADNLTVTAKYETSSSQHQYKNRIFEHLGTGQLYLQDISTAKGYQVGDPAKGGCIYSAGSVKLKNVVVVGCKAMNTGSGNSYGGGVYAKATLAMTSSYVAFNGSKATTGKAFGGGTWSHGLRADFSAIALNGAGNAYDSQGFGGGVQSSGDTYISNSTIALNQSARNIGGINVSNGNFKLVNSTISSNTATSLGGGAYISSPQIEIFNSTITANYAGFASTTLAPGAQFHGTGASPTVVMQSSIVASNFYGPSATDNDLTSNVAITGSNNLVRAAVASLPSDTILGKCPLLGPLASNGGPTKTHKVLGHSPAIDAGNNTFGTAYDQRGPQTINGERNYPRVSGPLDETSRADIGAYEVDRADVVFDTDFDSC